MITLETTHGLITIELDFENTPHTATNFLNYARDGFYEGTLFHRVINNFMIQGGGLNQEMQKKPTRAPIKNEANKGKTNQRGTLAMARTNDPDSATAQFFINVVDNGFLNFSAPTERGWGYCVFGKVTEGMDVVDKIKQVKTGSRAGHQDVPLDNVIIQKVIINESRIKELQRATTS